MAEGKNVSQDNPFTKVMNFLRVSLAKAKEAIISFVQSIKNLFSMTSNTASQDTAAGSPATPAAPAVTSAVVAAENSKSSAAEPVEKENPLSCMGPALSTILSFLNVPTMASNLNSVFSQLTPVAKPKNNTLKK